MMDADGEPALPAVHEDLRRRPHDWASAPTPTRRRTRPRRAASAPRASACSAPSTCSTARARDEPLFLLRKMIVSATTSRSGGRRSTSCSRSSRSDIKATLEAMDGLPVTIRLLDPPLHEFVPQRRGQARRSWPTAWASPWRSSQKRGRRPARDQPDDGPPRRAPRRHLSGGHARCRSGRSSRRRPSCSRTARRSLPGDHDPGRLRRRRSSSTRRRSSSRSTPRCCAKYGLKKIPHMYGTMIEIPRAALTADKIAETAEFFSLRHQRPDADDASASAATTSAASCRTTSRRSILPADPFQTLDQEGVGQLIQIGIERGRKTRQKLEGRHLRRARRRAATRWSSATGSG